MDKIESLEDFYKRKFDWMPDNIRNEIGHFNVFGTRSNEQMEKATGL
ncbi:MAG: hypothetical protein ACKV1O_15580 [Saprospiraceae bacterium]